MRLVLDHLVAKARSAVPIVLVVVLVVAVLSVAGNVFLYYSIPVTHTVHNVVVDVNGDSVPDVVVSGEVILGNAPLSVR